MKVLASAFIIALLFSALAVAVLFGTVHAKPSVPEFTLSYVVRPYDIGPSYTIDPYTGENITLVPEIHTTTARVLITVKNQPFSPYADADGNYIELWYNVSLKGHFGDTWGHYPNSRALDLYNASASAETVIDIPLGEWPELGPNSQLDFRLEALIGHFNYDSFGAITGFSTYEASGWSNTQTITVYPSSSSPTPTPSPAATPTSTPYQEPQQTDQTETIIGVAIVVAVLGAGLGLLIYLIKRK